MNEARYNFYKSTFEEQLNEKKNLIGCKNGIIDLDNKIHRQGTPDDLITLSTKTNYITKEKYINTPEYKEIMDFYKQVHLTYEMVEYSLKERAIHLHGNISEERFFIHVGDGGNGKSKERELCALSLGDYCCGIPITFFTGRKASSNATSSEIIRTKGRRMIFVDEPEEGDKLNIGSLKKFTGGDPVEARGLYKDMIEFYPQFYITFNVNDIPEWNAHDRGAQRRASIIEYEAVFKKNPDPNNPNEFKVDKTISEKIKRWKHIYFSILVDYYYKYCEEGLNPPQKVITSTKKIIADFDKYNAFITDTLIKAEPTENVCMRYLYNAFKDWFEEAGLNTRDRMSYKEFKKYVSKQLRKNGTVKQNKLFGYRKEK